MLLWCSMPPLGDGKTRSPGQANRHSLQGVDRHWTERDRAPAGMRLRRANLAISVRALSHMQLARFEIDGSHRRPRSSEARSPVNARGHQQRPDLSAGSVDETADLVRCWNVDADRELLLAALVGLDGDAAGDILGEAATTHRITQDRFQRYQHLAHGRRLAAEVSHELVDEVMHLRRGQLAELQPADARLDVQLDVLPILGGGGAFSSAQLDRLQPFLGRLLDGSERDGAVKVPALDRHPGRIRELLGIAPQLEGLDAAPPCWSITSAMNAVLCSPLDCDPGALAHRHFISPCQPTVVAQIVLVAACRKQFR